MTGVLPATRVNSGRQSFCFPLLEAKLPLARMGRTGAILTSNAESCSSLHLVVSSFCCVCVCAWVCVRAEWQNTLPPQLLMISTAGGQGLQ